MSRLYTGRKITWADKIRDTHWARDSAKKKKITEEHSIRMVNLIENGNYNHVKNKGFLAGYYQNKKSQQFEYYRSSYELRRMNQLDATSDVVSWTTQHNIRIPYAVSGSIHHYIPDFLIEYNDGNRVLEEVKGWIRDGFLNQLKNDAALAFCDERGWSFKFNLMKNDNN